MFWFFYNKSCKSKNIFTQKCVICVKIRKNVVCLQQKLQTLKIFDTKVYYLCKYSGKFCVLQKSCKTKLFLTQKCVINLKIREKICLFATKFVKS